GVMAIAGGIFSIVALFPLLRSLGPLPKNAFYTTPWRKGAYLTQSDGRRVKSTDVPIGSFVTVFPQDALGGALSQTILIHVQDAALTTKPGRETWGPDG